MNQMNVAPPFPVPVTFEDVDDTILVREEARNRGARELIAAGAWSLYLRKVLPPLPRETEGHVC